MNRVMAFVDGENMVFRYQAMLAAGKKINPSVIHEKDAFVWHTNVGRAFGDQTIRISYYTSVVGDSEKVASIKNKLAGLVALDGYRAKSPTDQRVVPFVFKREANQRKTRVVDAHITVDVLRHVYQDQVDTVYLLSADTDYIPLIEEVMRRGKRVVVGALSDSVTDRLRNIADGFHDLDNWFFL
jgi:uncharacterized LabA/DUF88 family protein